LLEAPTRQGGIIKTLIWLGLLVAVGVYGSGSWTFREAGIKAMLDKWEDDARRGDAQATCDSFAPDMTFSMHGTVNGRSTDREGDRAQMCADLQKLLPVLAKVVTDVKVTRDNLKVTRHGLHWWTAEVSYNEHRDRTLQNGMHLKTLSADHLVLVKSFDGVRLKRLESDERLDR
jgi:hypothetical protein